MRVVLLFIIYVLSTASLAHAQGGSIGVFADVNGLECDLYEPVSGLVTVYAVHVFTPGASGCQFRVDDSMTSMTYLAEEVTPPYLSLGNARDGIAITYGGCVAGPNKVLNISYYSTGTTPACTEIRVVEDPTAVPPGIYVADCAYPTPNLLLATGGTMVVNPDASCGCYVPIEATNWGRIKQLYR